jgi:hypothetical protein
MKRPLPLLIIEYVAVLLGAGLIVHETSWLALIGILLLIFAHNADKHV